MPVGVDVTVATRSGPTGAVGDEAATYFVAGQTERGPVDKAVVLYSLGDYLAVFGNRVAYGALYDDLRTHFEEQGTRAVVARVVGAGATVGTLTLKDQNGGTQANTLRIDAAFPGARSTGITVQVVAGSATGLFSLLVYLDGVLRESFIDLSSPADAQNQTAKSFYVKVTDLGSGTTAPLNNPTVVAATALSAGNDDRGSITAANYIAALARFGEVGVDKTGVSTLLGAGVVAIPGQARTAVGLGLVQHCLGHQRICLTSDPVGTSQATATANWATLIAAVTAAGGGGLECLGGIFGGVRIPDVGNVVRTITAEGYVAAARARAIALAGPERAPIGLVSEGTFVIEPEVAVDRPTADALDAVKLIPIRSIGGKVRVYGWRSASGDPNYKLLKYRDLLNAIQVDAQRIAEDEVGDTIDGSGHAAARLKAALMGLLDPIAKRGGLFPRNGDAGYSVDVGPGINTDALAAADTLAAVMGCRVAPTAEKVNLTIVLAALAANL